MESKFNKVSNVMNLKCNVFVTKVLTMDLILNFVFDISAVYCSFAMSVLHSSF